MLPPGYVLYKYQELDSTNSTALRLLQDGKIQENTIIVADRQSAGRGRNGKEWLSLSGNLYMTIVIKREVDMSLLPQISFITAVAVGKSLEKVDLEYKWPNDLMISGKKFSGILIESHDQSFIIIGIGVNIQHSPDYGAYLQKYYEVDIDMLINDIIRNFAFQKKQWQENGFALTRQEWLAKAWRLKQELTITVDNQNLTGIMQGIDEQGRLILTTAQDKLHITSGTIHMHHMN